MTRRSRKPLGEQRLYVVNAGRSRATHLPTRLALGPLLLLAGAAQARTLCGLRVVARIRRQRVLGG